MLWSLPGAWPGNWSQWSQWGQWAASAWQVWQVGQMSSDAIRAIAAYRLERLVAFARERSPFYRDWYRSAPTGAVCLQDLPVLTKRDVMASFDRVATDRQVTRACVERFTADARRVGRPLLDRYAVWTSSGSTGNPGIFVSDVPALAVYDALELIRFRGFAPIGVVASALALNERYAMVSATGGHFAGNCTFERLRQSQPWLAARARVFSILQPVESLVQQLNEFQPTHLVTYPTAAYLLGEEQLHGRLRLGLQELWTGGEQLSDSVRQHVQGAFGCNVRDEYGASEFLPIAAPCHRGTLHVNADWVLLEPVDAHYCPVAPEVASHSVLLTNLANRVQPLIRYDLGDSVTLLPPCACGSPLPSIRVEGRCDDVVKLRNGAGRVVMLLPLALTTVLEDEAGVFGFQLLQVGPSELELRLEQADLGGQAQQRCQAALRHYLREQALSNVTLHVTHTPPERHPVSGKLRRVIAQPAPPPVRPRDTLLM